MARTKPKFDDTDAKGKILIVIGGQFGSESKGLIIEHLANNKAADIHVRTGAQNAGHSIWYRGKKYAMQSIPCGWVDESSTLCIGAGGYIEPKLLESEIKLILEATCERQLTRLFIDDQAGLHKEEHINQEVAAKLHENIGSTAHGCMEASVDKMRRNEGYKNFSQTAEGQALASKYGFKFTNVSKLLNDAYDGGETILLEGTQGTMLDMYHGSYPYVTSRSTIAANWLAEAGLSPTLNVEVIMVCRTFPIRVAGNSGPLPNEIEWVDLAREINVKRNDAKLPPVIDPDLLNRWELDCLDMAYTIGLPSARPSSWTREERSAYSEKLVNFHKVVMKTRYADSAVAELKKLFEITTVTKKLRRIGRLDWAGLKKAVELNRPTSLAVNFLNYVFPSLEHCSTKQAFFEHPQYVELNRYLNEWKENLGVEVRFISANSKSVVDLRAG